MKRTLLIALFLIISLHRTYADLQAADGTPTPLPAHCIGAGPLTLPLIDPGDPDFCGCTWGSVYYRGQPVEQAEVSLQFDDRHFRAYTTYRPIFPDYPYYIADGKGLGAHRSDILTLTVDFAGETLVRPFRSLPEAVGESKGEQQVPLVLTEEGEWRTLFTGGYTRTLTIQNATLWAGGPAGLTAFDLITKSSTPQRLPWPESRVTAFAISPNNDYWVTGPHHLAMLRGQTWQAVAAPFAETIRTLAVDPQSGDLWVGGGDSTGQLARYAGQSWQLVDRIHEPIITLVIDQSGGVWAGTWEGGVYHLPNGATDLAADWVRYQMKDGLGSERVYSAATGADSVWFGTDPVLIATDRYKGGLSRYDLSEGTWQTYTTTHGLPTAGDLPGAPGRSYALALDSAGQAWVGTGGTVHRQIAAARWITDTRTVAPVTALATAGDLVIAAQANGTILYLDRSITPGEAPVAQLSPPTTTTITLSDTLRLSATAIDQDEEQRDTAAQILAWDWSSDVDGPLCTTAHECTLPATLLTVGEHTISLRVQDDEGVWSAPVTTAITIQKASKQTEPPDPPKKLYLPLVVAE